MNRPDWRLHLTAFITGLLLVPARLFLWLFPFFNLLDVMLFGAAAALLAYGFRVRPSWWVVLVFLPVWLFVVLGIVSWVGVGNLPQGVGVGHLVSLALIPLSTLAGAYYGSKLARASLAAQT